MILRNSDEENGRARAGCSPKQIPSRRLLPKIAAVCQEKIKYDKAGMREVMVHPTHDQRKQRQVSLGLELWRLVEPDRRRIETNVMKM